MRAFPFLLTIGLVLACGGERAAPLGEPSTEVRWAAEGEHAGALAVDGAPLGALRRTESGWRLLGPNGAPLAEIRVEERALTAEHAFPRRVRREAAGAGARFRDEYTLLAPAAPLPVEGYGLVVSSDEPGINDAEHEMLRDWLAAQGLPADTGPFQRLHERETGRELRVWYEISGRRIDGRFSDANAPETATRLDALFRSEAGGLKIHHQRPGENGRFTYQRESLELADRIAAPGLPDLVAHECGCYGYAIASDFTTLGDALYTVEADWVDDRVGADFFIGFERRERFPWIGVGERRRIRDLARRARAWTLRDAAGVRFAEVTLALPDDPPRGGIGAIGYRFDRFDAADRRQPLAHVGHSSEELRLSFYDVGLDEGLGALDRWLAAMPVQVVRGDGIRDSHLGAIELLVDAVRLVRAPSAQRVADFASEVDAASAAAKVEALLAPERERFAVATDALPPAPIAGPGHRAIAEARSE
ncbi:MAG: hypothetical protein ABFS41_13640 [Myxococcota bacterium]